MAADLHIHVFGEGEFTEDDFRDMFSNVLGSKWFNPSIRSDYSIYEKCYGLPNIWIGEVSWLKANLTGDGETFIPDPVGKVSEIVGEHQPIVDDEFIDSIRSAFNSDNTTMYNCADKEDVVEFLNAHRGKRAFTISW